MTEREPSSSLKGKMAATLIGIACAQGSNGEFNLLLHSWMMKVST